MKAEEKTNVMRLLDGRKIPYAARSYEPDPSMTGEEIALLLNEDPGKVYKTLVTEGKAAGEKSVSMIRQKDLLPLTGYVHGGCSPLGMKKVFPTFIHETAEREEQIFVSAGRVGFQVGVNPKDLASLIRFTFADLTADS